jgi:hypothetical protein
MHSCIEEAEHTSIAIPPSAVWRDSAAPLIETTTRMQIVFSNKNHRNTDLIRINIPTENRSSASSFVSKDVNGHVLDSTL